MFRSIRRIWIKILILLIFLFAIVGGLYFFWQKYKVVTVYVEGNYHYTQEEIKDIVMQGPLGENSLYLSLKYKNKGIENVPFVDVMDVTILSPDTIQITVYEKALAGFVKYMGYYMYFDKDGYIVANSSVKTLGVPQITGLSFEYAVVGEPLPVEDPNIFNDILTATKLLKKYNLDADKIYFHDSASMTMYFGNIKVALGDERERLEDKLMLLPDFLQELANSRGTLMMNSYDTSNGKYTFKPE